MIYLGAGSQPQASVSCRAIHSAVGWAVTPSHMIWRRPCRRINKAYSSRNEIVGTTNRSIDAIPSAWLRRNVFQPWDGGLLRLAMYLATEVWPTSMPSLRSSPWILHSRDNRFDSLPDRWLSGGARREPWIRLKNVRKCANLLRHA